MTNRELNKLRNTDFFITMEMSTAQIIEWKREKYKTRTLNIVRKAQARKAKKGIIFNSLSK